MTQGRYPSADPLHAVIGSSSRADGIERAVAPGLELVIDLGSRDERDAPNDLLLQPVDGCAAHEGEVVGRASALERVSPSRLVRVLGGDDPRPQTGSGLIRANNV